MRLTAIALMFGLQACDADQWSGDPGDAAVFADLAAADLPDAAGDPSACEPFSWDASAALPSFACGPEAAVSSLQDLLPLLGSDWQLDGPFVSSVLPVTVDLRATSALTLDSSQIPIPPFCQADPMCRQLVLFYIFPANLPIDGVTLGGDADAGSPHQSGFVTDAPLLMASAGARFRLRPVEYADHPYYSYVPMIEVLPPCTQPCAADWLRCPGDGVCYPAGADYCNRCQALGVDRCACLTSAGPASDGTECSYFLITDVIASGTCRCGRCGAGSP